MVENRPGASGSIASKEVAKSAPDGNTLMLITVTTHAAVPHVINGVPFDTIEDFTHITYVGHINMLLAVPSSLPINTVDQLIRYSKNNTLTYGSSGVGSTEHFSGEQFKQLSGANIIHVPYKGAALMTQDLIGGHISMTFSTYPALMPHIKSGKMRALAVLTDRRLTDLPEVPTLKELGYNVVTPTWYGISGPKGITSEKISAIDREIRAILQMLDVQEKIRQAGGEPSLEGNPEKFTRFVKSENQRLRDIAKKANISSK
jgi:tripartite-type tricarboxylate transporter receptor subunit TctC